MARKPAAVKRTTMKVPVTFKDRVAEQAKNAGMGVPTFLEDKKVIVADV